MKKKKLCQCIKKWRRSWRSELSQAARCSECCGEKENIALVLPVINSRDLNTGGSPSHWLLPNCFHLPWTSTEGESLSSRVMMDPSSPPVVSWSAAPDLKLRNFCFFHPPRWNWNQPAVVFVVVAVVAAPWLLLTPGCAHKLFWETENGQKKKSPQKIPLIQSRWLSKMNHNYLFLCIFSHFYLIPELYKFYFSGWIEHFYLKQFFGVCWYRPFIFN